METLLVYALCTASMFYLGSRAVITSWLWSRYPRKLASFFDCSACSGTWYGALVGYVGGYHLGLAFLGMPGDQPATVAAVALASMTFTPIVAGLAQRAFETLGSAVSDDDGGFEPAKPVVPIEERTVTVAPTVFAENLDATHEVQEHLFADTKADLIRARQLREVSGTITPREIPIRTITIPPRGVCPKCDGQHTTHEEQLLCKGPNGSRAG